ncbi:MAG: hypothetical protein RBR68_03715 [Tenuifilaceae bacterium]|jgi:hypothetical protein|nr:hypothetical protein [Tenuifilaceae bacterium]
MYKINTEKLFIWLLFSLTIIISLAPFFKIGFTTADDLENYMSLIKRQLFNEAWIYAKGAGRFYFIFTKPLYSLPYIGESFIVTKIIQSFSLVLSYSLFSLLINKLFKSKELALALFLLLIMATPASANYYLPFIAYPFYFSFSFSILICSFLLFIRYTETQKYKYVIYSAVVLFIAILFYETYLVFLVFLCFYIFFRNFPSLENLKSLFKNKKFYKELIPIVSVAVLYVALYFGFRQIFLGETDLYHGSSFAKNFSFTNYFKLIGKLTHAILPINLFNRSQSFIIQNSLSPIGHINNFRHILLNSNLISIVNAIIQIFFFAFIALRFDKKITYKSILIGIIVASLFAISAHSILGVAEKYNAIEYAYIKGYVTSFYSYFGIWVIILLLFYLMIKWVNRIKCLKYGVILALSLVIGYISIITSYTNDHVSRGWEKSQLRFTLLDDLFKEGAFNKVDNGSVFYTPEMYDSDPLGYVLAAQNFNWSNYIHVKFDRVFFTAKNPQELQLLINQNPEAKVYRFIKNHTQKLTNFMFVVAEINKETIDFNRGTDLFMNATCNKADIHYYSATKDFMFIFHPKDSENKKAEINGFDFIELHSGYNQIKVISLDKHDKISSFSIESEVEMYSEMFSISNMISDYTQQIRILENDSISIHHYSDIEASIVVESTDVFPLRFTPQITLKSSYLNILLTAKLEISNYTKDENIQIVVEIRNNKNNVIYWDSKAYSDFSLINFDHVINLKGVKNYNQASLKFYLWNPNGCEFTIDRISNISVKIF